MKFGMWCGAEMRWRGFEEYLLGRTREQASECTYCSDSTIIVRVKILKKKWTTGTEGFTNVARLIFFYFRVESLSIRVQFSEI